MATRSQLRVEGNDDSHALRHLLMRHGVDYDHKPWPTWFPSIEETGGKDKLLETLALNVRASSGRAVGFVLDANSSLQSRWDAVAAQLGKLDLEVPEEIPREGFVGGSRRFQARVGVWLMPDNRQEGALEHFLETLVQEGDSLFDYARESTENARAHGARYPEAVGETMKAVLHTWLAWQEEPGLPYGTAIRARYFRHDSEVAECFVRWFRRVFEAVPPHP